MRPNRSDQDILARDSANSYSFQSLVAVHRQLDELFLSHQEALLSMNIALASERLGVFEQALKQHMRDEEELLLPVYTRAGRIAGGPPEFFTGEHRRMLEFIDRFKLELNRLGECQEDLKRRIIRLLDQEAAFKNLVEHHDEREFNILYPTLDQVTDAAERKSILSKCRR
jgi:hemerythrin-like domain-containing protein